MEKIYENKYATYGTGISVFEQIQCGQRLCVSWLSNTKPTGFSINRISPFLIDLFATTCLPNSLLYILSIFIDALGK